MFRVLFLSLVLLIGPGVAPAPAPIPIMAGYLIDSPDVPVPQLYLDTATLPFSLLAGQWLTAWYDPATHLLTIRLPDSTDAAPPLPLVVQTSCLRTDRLQTVLTFARGTINPGMPGSVLRGHYDSIHHRLTVVLP